MSAHDLPTPRSIDELLFDASRTSPFLKRGIELLASLARESQLESDPQLIWWIDIDQYWNGNVVGLVAVAGLVVLATDSVVWAFDGHTGAEQWKIETRRDWFLGIRSSFGDIHVIAQRESGAFDVIESRTGKLVWRHLNGTTIWPIGNQPIVIKDGQHLMAVEQETGCLLWMKSLLQLYDDADSVVVSDGVLYLFEGSGDGVQRHHSEPTMSCSLVAVESITGEVLWNMPIDSWSRYSALPMQDGIFVQCRSGAILCLSASSGQVLLQFKSVKSLRPYSFVGDSVIMLDDDNVLHAFNRSTGRKIWDFALSNRRYHVPCGAGRSLLIMEHDAGFESDRLFAINASTGALQWLYEEDAAFGYAVELNGIVYMIVESLKHEGSSSESESSWVGVLTSIDLETGKRLWSKAMPINYIDISNGIVFAASMNRLCAWETTNRA